MSTTALLRKFNERFNYESVRICGCKRDCDREYRPRGVNGPVVPIVTGPGRWLTAPQRDALTRWLPEEQRQRAFAECALIVDDLIGPWREGGPQHHVRFSIFDGVPSHRQLPGGRTQHLRPTIAEASTVDLEISVRGVLFDSRESILAQTARFLRRRAADLITSAERLERADAGRAVP
jgi:hypothetical protein